jgi:hypothetical protein
MLNDAVCHPALRVLRQPELAVSVGEQPATHQVCGAAADGAGVSKLLEKPVAAQGGRVLGGGEHRLRPNSWIFVRSGS